jgi:Flp pilus assembly protein TadD
LQGKQAFEEGDYSAARASFTTAFKLDCTKSQLLLNIARSSELLGSRAEAAHALRTYMERDRSLSADDKGQLQHRIDNLMVRP